VVTVPAPVDAGDRRDASDAEPDGDIPDVSLPAHGPTPIWPAAESELSLAVHADPMSVELELDPSPSQLDLHFNVDTTASFGGEIFALQRELTRSIIPELRARVADASFGVSRFADFPIDPFGASGRNPDRPFVLLTPITDILSHVTSAVARLDAPLGNGADNPEAGGEALYQVATGAGYKLETLSLIAAFDHLAASGGGTLGGVGFRDHALRVVVHITDALSHTLGDYAKQGVNGAHGMPEAITALQQLNVHAIGICSSGSANPDYAKVRNQLSQLALATGSRMAPKHGSCATGIGGLSINPYANTCPLVFDIAADGTGLATSVVDAVAGLLDSVSFAEVHAEVGDDPLGFIQRIELSPHDQASGVASPAESDRLPLGKPDGVPDSYLDVTRKTRLGFKVTLQNGRIADADVDQRFRVSIRLLGDGVLLEERFLRVLVPAAGAQPTAADD
jgi:hypothetical protein